MLQTLSELFVEHGPPAMISGPTNGPEFTAKVVREWLERVEVKTLYIEPGSPWENGYNESFNGTLGEEVLKREIFYSLEEAGKCSSNSGGGSTTPSDPTARFRYRPPCPRSATARSLLLECCPSLTALTPDLQEWPLRLTQ